MKFFQSSISISTTLGNIKPLNLRDKDSTIVVVCQTYTSFWKIFLAALLCCRMMMLRMKRSFSVKIPAPPLVYITGEEMSRYAGELFLNEWIRPYVDISKWEFYDLSCKSRDQTNDQVLENCIKAGKRIGAIYKEPTM